MSEAIALAKSEAPSGELGAGTDTTRGALSSGASVPHAAALVKSWLRALLGDGDPPAIPGDYRGPWAEEVLAVASAHQAGGVASARRAFDALARAHPGLATLVAGEPEPARTRWTAAELLSAEFPEPAWIVPGLLPVGLTMLAGRPKMGKSWLALQIATAVATGGVALGERVRRGKVLYLAMEDSARRLQERCRKLGVPPDAEITFWTRWEPLASGGLALLQSEMERGGYRLAVLDTFSRLAGRANQDDVGDMTMLLDNLQQVALLCGAAALTVDHHRKSAGFAANEVDDLLGSTAKSAVADAIWGLYRERGQHQATLRVSGRDMGEREIALQFDGLTGCWQAVGEAGEVRRDSLANSVLVAIGDLMRMGEVATVTTIATHLGRTKGGVSKALAELVHAGQVHLGKKSGRVQPYQLPDKYK